GNMWITGTYDPQLNLVYVGTGNPTPVLAAQNRPGDNPWTCSIVAINPDTGKLAWGFQASPHDTHDWDAVEVPVLVDGKFKEAARQIIVHPVLTRGRACSSSVRGTATAFTFQSRKTASMAGRARTTASSEKQC